VHAFLHGIYFLLAKARYKWSVVSEIVKHHSVKGSSREMDQVHSGELVPPCSRYKHVLQGYLAHKKHALPAPRVPPLARTTTGP